MNPLAALIQQRCIDAHDVSVAEWEQEQERQVERTESFDRHVLDHYYVRFAPSFHVDSRVDEASARRAIDGA
jgi:hypothetical protein